MNDLKECIRTLNGLKTNARNIPSGDERKWLNQVQLACECLVNCTSEFAIPVSVPYAEFQSIRKTRNIERVVSIINGLVESVETIMTIIEKEEEAAKSSSARRYKDVFISHASPNQQALVQPVVDAIDKMKIDRYYYKDRREIAREKGLNAELLSEAVNSRFALIFFSKSFFESDHTLLELKAFLAKQRISSERIIVPVLYGVSWNEVLERYCDLRIGEVFADKPNENDEPRYIDAGSESELKEDIINEIAFELAGTLIAYYGRKSGERP